MANTRATSEALCKKLYVEIGLTAKAVTYLLKTCGLNSPVSIIQTYNSEKIYDLVKPEEEFLLGDAARIETLAQYLEYYRNANSGFTDLSSRFTTEAFESFDPKKAASRTATGTATGSTSATNKKNASDIAICTGDFPKFSGKSADWTNFCETFSAVCELKHLEDILEENENHDDLFKDDDEYREKCQTLYSILKA